MNDLDRIEKLAAEAAAEAEGDWFDPELLASDALISSTRTARKFMHAMTPEVAQQMVAAIRAAQDLIAYSDDGKADNWPDWDAKFDALACALEPFSRGVPMTATDWLAAWIIANLALLLVAVRWGYGRGK